MTSNEFDIAVLGGGPGGYVCAIRAAQLGMRAVVVERENLGGVCLNWGCIPTKSLLRSAEILHLLQRASEFGVRAGRVEVAFEAIIDRSRSAAGQLRRGVEHLLRKNGVEVRMGEASIAEPGCVEVQGAGVEPVRFRCGAIIVATGARARELPGFEPDGELVWTYRHALAPPRLPRRMLVIGSGAIGIEFAHFYQALGAQVTVAEILERILPAEDEEVSAFAAKAFRGQGMRLMTAARVKDLRRERDVAAVRIESASGTVEEQFDCVLCAVGIVGNVEGLGLEAVGARVDRGRVVVDSRCRTGVKGLWAIGDVAGPPWLAHKASHEGILAAEDAAGRDPRPLDRSGVPGCTYCHPQIASVGLTEAAARAAGRDIRLGRFPLIGNGKAIAYGDTGGFVKTVFDAASGELLGAHMVGPDVTEMIQGFAIARSLETTEEELIHAVFPHPTISEAMHESVLDAFGRAIHF